jgi:hypothetical protein
MERAASVAPLLDDAPINSEPNRSAVLKDVNKRNWFSLMIHGWASTSPCTRYDEWMICQAELNMDGDFTRHKGPFLLRYEIEELAQGLTALIDGQEETFSSSFLASILSVNAERLPDGLLELTVTLTLPENQGKQQPLSLKCSSEAVKQLCSDLCRQLEACPSLL